MTVEPKFLSDLRSLPWPLGTKYDFHPIGLFIGEGSNAIEIAVVRSSKNPTRAALLEFWKARKAGRAAPVLLIVLCPESVYLFGPTGDESPVYKAKDSKQIERFCREALDQPDRHAALRFLSQTLPSLETSLPGINNQGLLALHELQNGVPKRPDWEEAKHKATKAVSKSDTKLLSALGFDIEPLDNLTSILRDGTRRTALAVMLYRSESPESGNFRFNNLSPVSYALKKADDENISWVVLVQGNRLRLYSTDVDAGVGRRGRTETYVECQPCLLSDEHLSYLWLIYSAEALAPDGSLWEILGNSSRFSGSLAEKLRERIYGKVVPTLAQGIAKAQNIDHPGPENLKHTYGMALTVLFRLLFIAYAEDRDLLPYKSNEAYRRRSLKQKAQELARCVTDKTPISHGSHHWEEAALLWKAVDSGNSELGVPPYNGGLFSDLLTFPTENPSPQSLSTITLPNEVFESALRDLLVIETSEGIQGAVDFRSLGVREFGTIYEGLLESELSVAQTDLTLDRNGTYVPARQGRNIRISKGEIYLHNRSGARKSSGSYYTKPFAVKHLIEGALEPALKEHFNRLDSMDEVAAAEAFFDFRIADIAMGSGHFLISAVDHIEKLMADYLAENNLPGVRAELDILRKTAHTRLGESRDAVDIEDSQLLRRMIARRCIYGVDINGLAVQLARLSVWIHTFVPGLPLSFLDHNLVQGNSLIGIGSIEDIRRKFEELSRPLFPVDAKSLLGPASVPLKRLANINDSTLQDIATAKRAMEEAREAITSTEALCDLITAQLISDDPEITGFDFENWGNFSVDPESLDIVLAARKSLENIAPLHFPIAFPEVFLRKRQGFDVILGNPPWDKVKVEEHAFWTRHFPGFRGLQQRDQEEMKEQLRKERPDLVFALETELIEMEQIRKALVGSAYPGIGSGDPDLYKAFCWRFWNLIVTENGRIGVVLPRGALTDKGAALFRFAMFTESKSVNVTTLLNNRKWVFPEVDGRYSIGLVCIARGEPEEKNIKLHGPFRSYAEFLECAGLVTALFSLEEVLEWGDSISLPLFPTLDSVEIFTQLRKTSRLGIKKGGGGGEPDHTGKWMLLCRKNSWISIIGGTVASPTVHRTSRHSAKEANGSQKRRATQRILACLQRGIIQSLEPRYQNLLCMGRSQTRT